VIDQLKNRFTKLGTRLRMINKRFFIKNRKPFL
jgi:hypothetical protein